MFKKFLKTRSGVLVSRAVSLAIVLLGLGLITGKLNEPNWFFGVFVLANLIMLLVDFIRGRVSKSPN